MRKSAIATFISTIALVAVMLVSACSPERPDSSRGTAVPSDMPGARNSASFTNTGDAIRIAYPLPGTVLTNTVTVQGTANVAGAEYHVGLASGGRYLAEGTVTPALDGVGGTFSFTLTFEPVAAPSDGEVSVYTKSRGSGSVEDQAVVPVRLAPANATAISGPTIHLSPNSGKAGTLVSIMGEGFPPDSSVEVRLSGMSTEATEQEYVTGRTGSNGDFKLSLTMPAFWPNGDPILGPQVLVVASTPDFISKASALFAYGSLFAPESGTPFPDEQSVARMAEQP